MGISYADESRVGVVMTTNGPSMRKSRGGLLRQTHPKVEIVIVDDGSEEVHVKRLEKFVDSKKDYNKSVKLEKLAKPGQYLGEARNFGCSKLSEKTEYVLFSDDDNLAETNEIETMLRVLVHTKADVVTASNEFFVTSANGTNVVVGSYHPLGNALFPGIFENVFGDANALWRKSAFTSLDGFAKDTSYSLQDGKFLPKPELGLKLVTVPAPRGNTGRTRRACQSKRSLILPLLRTKVFNLPVLCEDSHRWAKNSSSSPRFRKKCAKNTKRWRKKCEIWATRREVQQKPR